MNSNTNTVFPKTLLSLTVGVAFLIGQSVAAPIVIKFSHVVSPSGHPKGEAASLLSKRVNSEMAGKIKMEVFPNSQLYDDNKLFEALLLGDVHMGAPSLSKFEQYTKKYRLFDLPFLFNDMQAVNKFQNGPHGESLLNAISSQGLLGLAFWQNGLKQISANKPLLMPSDAKGLKFRVQASDVLVAQFRQLGANPQKMAFKEVYGALSTGVIDGQENTWSNIYTKKFFEVQDGVTESNHGLIQYMLITSKKFWDDLPAGTRSQLAKIIQEVTLTSNSRVEKINEDNKRKVIASGSTVRQLSNSQRNAWVKAMKPVWKKFEKDVGKDVIEAALAASE